MGDSIWLRSHWGMQEAIERSERKARATAAVGRAKSRRNDFKIDVCAKGVLALYVTLARQGVLDEGVFADVVEELNALDVDEDGKVDVKDLMVLLFEEENYQKVRRRGRYASNKVRRQVLRERHPKA